MTAAQASKLGTIVCATDFSDTAELALAHAVAMVRRHAARLVLAHVVEPLPVAPYPLLAVPADGEMAIREVAHDRLEKAAAALREQGLPNVETRLVAGAPGYELIALAEELEADLFVIGTRGLSGFEHLLFGSTAEHVVRRSRCPVLIVHPGDGAPREVVGTVVVPTDLSPDAEAAVEAFVRLYDVGVRPRVVLAFADQTPPYLEPFQHETLARWHQPDLRKEEIEKQMQPTVERLSRASFEVSTVVLDGSPVGAITQLAEERQAEMIVMSTHGRSALVNVLLGRTAQRIVQHARCPVLTVRPGGRAVD
ncbi:MAG TPA: universal stress protein [Myxococcota bacterium]|nr:universal stress protein [Myxococcota bacterium]